MNKAFTREPEDHGDRCPVCGSIGREVLQATLEAHLPAETRDGLSNTAFFCPFPSCEVAYFDRFERTVPTVCLLTSVYPKDPTAPICPCFGLTCEEIEADVRAGDLTRLKQHRAQAESDASRCTTMNAAGESCVPAVQRYFMRKREELE